MTSVVLDSGVLIAIDRYGRRALAELWLRHCDRRSMRTHPLVVAQVWRDGSRQALLARFLQGVDVRPIDDEAGRWCGELLASTGSADPVDAAVVAIAADGDQIFTSDPDDISRLVEASGRAVRVVAV